MTSPAFGRGVDRTWLLLAATLAGLAMLGPFTIDTYLPSFPAIARDFGVTTLELQQTLSVYLISFAVMTLFHGTLSDSFGRRPVILAGLVVFSLASIGCALAQRWHSSESSRQRRTAGDDLESADVLTNSRLDYIRNKI